jgi:hypothetical protein
MHEISHGIVDETLMDLVGPHNLFPGDHPGCALATGWRADTVTLTHLATESEISEGSVDVSWREAGAVHADEVSV